MSTSREGPNPLRPYYKPPSIGIHPDLPSTTISGTHGLGIKNGSAASYASSAREMFSDIDYSDYLSESSPSSLESIQGMINDAFYKYLSVLLSQPFDVAKTVLQVRSQDAAGGSIPVPMADELRSHSSSYRDSLYSDYPSDDSDQDELTYFTSAAPSAHSYSPSRSRRRRSDISHSPASPKQSPPTHQLTLKRPDALMEVISQEWAKEGAWGVWKGSNATFVYSFLLNTIENWSRGLLSALLNVPDPGILGGIGGAAELIETQYPWASLGIAVGGAVTAALILAPLDLIRTKLILTSTSDPNRSLMHNLRNLPSYFCPTTLMIPTILHSSIPPAISQSTPIFLRSRLSIDPVLTPATYSLAKFLSRTVELFLRLPFETVLRRGQVAVLASPQYHARAGPVFEPMVNVGPYRGVVGTMWSIIREEGTANHEIAPGARPAKTTKKGKKTERKGQGIEGLWRGWRVGMWGLAGVWGAKAMSGSGSSGGEF